MYEADFFFCLVWIIWMAWKLFEKLYIYGEKKICILWWKGGILTRGICIFLYLWGNCIQNIYEECYWGVKIYKYKFNTFDSTHVQVWMWSEQIDHIAMDFLSEIGPETFPFIDHTAMNFLSEYKCEMDRMILMRVWICEMYKKIFVQFYLWNRKLYLYTGILIHTDNCYTLYYCKTIKGSKET